MSLPVAILVGGLATRLRPMTDQVPKALIEVAGKPFIIHQLNLLRQHGLTEIVLCVGYLGEKVKAVVGNGCPWDVSIRYVFDGPALLGTGGALRRALPLLGQAFFVVYGDSYMPCDYQAVEKAFWKQGRLGLMTVLHNADQWDRSNVLYQDGQIRLYDKQRGVPGMQHIDYGVGVLRSEAVAGYPPDVPLDLARIYRDLLTRGELAAFEVTERFYEIGSPAGLAELQRLFTERRGA